MKNKTEKISYFVRGGFLRRASENSEAPSTSKETFTTEKLSSVETPTINIEKLQKPAELVEFDQDRLDYINWANKPFDEDAFKTRQMYIESKGNSNAYNKKSGAAGLYQILDKYFKVGENPFDPKLNERYRDKMWKGFNNYDFISKATIPTVNGALKAAAYNWGVGNLQKALNRAQALGYDPYHDLNWLEDPAVKVPKETIDYVNFGVLGKDVAGTYKTAEKYDAWRQKRGLLKNGGLLKRVSKYQRGGVNNYSVPPPTNGYVIDPTVFGWNKQFTHPVYNGLKLIDEGLPGGLDFEEEHRDEPWNTDHVPSLEIFNRKEMNDFYSDPKNEQIIRNFIAKIGGSIASNGRITYPETFTYPGTKITEDLNEFNKPSYNPKRVSWLPGVDFDKLSKEEYLNFINKAKNLSSYGGFIDEAGITADSEKFKLKPNQFERYKAWNK